MPKITVCQKVLATMKLIDVRVNPHLQKIMVLYTGRLIKNTYIYAYNQPHISNKKINLLHLYVYYFWWYFIFISITNETLKYLAKEG